MLRSTFAGLAAVLMVGAAPALAAEPELKVNYNWTSPAETAAIRVLQKHIAEMGIKWQDFAVVQHDTGANVNVVNMIIGRHSARRLPRGQPGHLSRHQEDGARLPA